MVRATHYKHGNTTSGREQKTVVVRVHGRRHKEIDYTDALRPPDPTAFVASQITNNSFRMGWTPPADLTNVNGYRLLLIIPSPNSSANYFDVPGQDANYKIFTERGFGRPILPDTTYTLWIQSYNAVDGARIYSNVVTSMVTTSAATANVPGYSCRGNGNDGHWRGRSGFGLDRRCRRHWV